MAKYDGQGFWGWFKKLNPRQRRAFFHGRFERIQPYDRNFMRRAARQGYVIMEDDTIYHQGELATPEPCYAKEGENMGDHRSKDRVHFEVSGKHDTTRYAQLAARAFGMSPAQWRGLCLNNGTVICRPSQFARFLIWRNEEGVQNMFSELSPKLVAADQHEVLKRLDVSANPA